MTEPVDPLSLLPGTPVCDADGVELTLDRRTDFDDGWWLSDGSWVRDMRFVDGWMTVLVKG